MTKPVTLKNLPPTPPPQPPRPAIGEAPIPYQSQLLPAARLRCWVEGIGPILTHNPASMGLGGNTAKRGTRIPDPADEAEAGTYRLEDGSCGCKAESFIGAIAGKGGAASAWKWKKSQTMKSQLAHISAAEDLVPFYHRDGSLVTDYVIDVQPVIVQRARIMRARPRFDEWSTRVTIFYDPVLIKEPIIIVDILADAGSRIGICDHRPRFGRFKVVSYQLL